MEHYSVANDRDALNAIIDTLTFWIASNPEALEEKALEATVEAEFGDKCVEGKYHTLAHHGHRSGNPAPCECEITPIPDWSNVGLSHIDLDALGGCLRLAGYSPPFKGTIEHLFWRLAAKIDVQGYHKLASIQQTIMTDEGASSGQIARITRYYHAWCAWSAEHRYYPPRNSEALDCTGWVRSALRVVMDILEGDAVLLEAGDKWLEEQIYLEGWSFIKTIITKKNFTVIIRKSDKFVNHLYTTSFEDPADLVFAHNTTSGACTLSRADDDFPVNCAEIMQKIFGPNAGGRAAIAGSPRGKKYTTEEFEEFVNRLVKLLEN